MRAILRRAGSVMPWPAVVFVLLWVFIGATSAVDTYLTVRYRSTMAEENPAGQFLIRLGTRLHHTGPEQDVSLFVGAKMFGTILALGILLVLYYHWRGAAQVAVTCLSVFQLALLFYIFQ